MNTILFEDIVALDDGYYAFWPTTNKGAYSAKDLKQIVDLLELANERVDKLLYGSYLVR